MQPLYSSRPEIPEIPDVDPLALRTPPKVERKTLVIEIFQEDLPNKDDFFNNINANGKLTSSLPSVVIGVPDNEKKEKESTPVNIDPDKIFKTEGYYNEAEQAIEAALLRKGFNVLDRSKFEAKLRDLRDRANDTNWHPWWSNYEHLIENKEYDAVKTMLKNQLLEEKINQEDYITRISDIDKLSQIGLPGKKREEDELADIAEVIRAAQTGEDQADYLLQINKVSLTELGDKRFFISDLKVVRDFLQENPGLTIGSSSNSIPSNIRSSWHKASFNAKLIGIQTGSIVWLGSHEIESWSAEPVRITFDVQKKVSNVEEINNSIRAYNQSLATNQNKVKAKYHELVKKYDLATQSHEFEEEEELEKYKEDLESTIRVLKSELDNEISHLKDISSAIPVEANAPWQFSYLVSEPVIQPDLSERVGSDISQRQRIQNHRQELIRKVTQQLVSTIELK